MLVLIALELSDVLLGLGSDDHSLGTFLLSNRFDLTGKIVTVLSLGFADVADVENGLRREQEKVAGAVLFFLRFELHHTGVLTLFQHFFISFQDGHFDLGVLIAGSGSLLSLGQTALDGLEVLQLKLSIDDFLIADGVDGAVDVGDVIVLKATEHVDDSVRLANVSKEFVA